MIIDGYGTDKTNLQHPGHMKPEDKHKKPQKLNLTKPS